MAKEFIKLGFFLGIGGVLTFKNSNLYKLIENIDIENIVIETDSPFLSPEPLRGTKNIPSNVYYVAKKIADHVAFLNDGKIAWQGTKDEFLKSNDSLINSFINAQNIR